MGACLEQPGQRQVEASLLGFELACAQEVLRALRELHEPFVLARRRKLERRILWLGALAVLLGESIVIGLTVLMFRAVLEQARDLARR